MPLSWPELLLELRPQRPAGRGTGAGSGACPRSSADSRAVVPGTVYVAVRGSQADGHRFVADAVAPRRRRRWWSRRQQRPGVPEIVVRDGRRAALVLGARMVWSSRRAGLLAGRRHRHQREDHDHRPGAAPAQSRRDRRAASARSARSTGRARPCPPPPARSPRRGRSTCRATLAELAARGVHRCGDGGLVAQPRPGAARRPPLRRRRVHQPDPRPSRLPRHDGAYLAAKLRLLAPAGAERSRGGEPGRPGLGGDAAPRRAAVTFGLHPAADVRADRYRPRAPTGAASASAGRFGTARCGAAAARATSTSPTRSPRRPAPWASACR